MEFGGVGSPAWWCLGLGTDRAATAAKLSLPEQKPLFPRFFSTFSFIPARALAMLEVEFLFVVAMFRFVECLSFLCRRRNESAPEIKTTKESQSGRQCRDAVLRMRVCDLHFEE
jgi:hypothetical protein